MLLSLTVRITNSLAVMAADCQAPGTGQQPGTGGGGGELANPEPCIPPGLAPIANTWIAWAKGISMVVGALGLIACGAMMMIGRRNRSHLAGEGASGMLWVFAGACTVAFAVPFIQEIFKAVGE